VTGNAERVACRRWFPAGQSVSAGVSLGDLDPGGVHAGHWRGWPRHRRWRPVPRRAPRRAPRKRDAAVGRVGSAAHRRSAERLAAPGARSVRKSGAAVPVQADHRDRGAGSRRAGAGDSCGGALPCWRLIEPDRADHDAPDDGPPGTACAAQCPGGCTTGDCRHPGSYSLGPSGGTRRPAASGSIRQSRTLSGSGRTAARWTRTEPTNAPISKRQQPGTQRGIPAAQHEPPRLRRTPAAGGTHVRPRPVRP
jgi:hypothetical protein